MHIQYAMMTSELSWYYNESNKNIVLINKTLTNLQRLRKTVTDDVYKGAF